MPAETNDIQSLSYEQAFSELEEIVSVLENNSRPLEETIALFERGQALAQRCASLLEQAELRVHQLGGGEEKDSIEEPF